MNNFILRSKAVLFLALTLGIIACQDVIEFEVNRSGSQLVVDGTIVPGQSPQFLNLGFTSVKEQIPIPINGAKVTLFDGNGNSEAYEPALAEVDPNLPPNPDRPVIDGKYQFNANIITPEAGGTYHIEIVLPGGETYRSSSETIPDITIQDSLYTEFIEVEQLNDEGTSVTRRAVRVFTNSQLPDHFNPFFVKWKLEEVYRFTETRIPCLGCLPLSCYVTDFSDPQSFLLLDGTENSSRAIHNQVVGTSVINNTYSDVHFFNLIASGITKEAFDYWSKVDQVVNNQGTIFDVPPAKIRGNIRNIENPEELVFGYFSAASSDTARTSVRPDQLPVFVPDPCRNTRFPPAQCNNCLRFRESTYQAPSYFTGE